MNDVLLLTLTVEHCCVYANIIIPIMEKWKLDVQKTKRKNKIRLTIIKKEFAFAIYIFHVNENRFPNVKVEE